MEPYTRILILLVAIYIGLIVDIVAHRISLYSLDGGGKTTTYDVTRYGAVGDGKKDDHKAFDSTWNAACKSTTNDVTIVVPRGKTFLLSPIQFDGPCKPRTIKLEIWGKIVAPTRSSWKGKSKNQQWLKFDNVNGLRVDGNGHGLVDGQGDSWWKHVPNSESSPTAMRFSRCNDLQVRGLKHRNSQRNHISVDDCDHAIFANLDISAPETSPNTDGIDIKGSKNIHIQDSVIATGDDCIAINGGTSNINIYNIACGPGHGISVGSLGRYGKHDEVQEITVAHCTFQRTKNGVRIKTFQGGSGYARNITFSDIKFIEANNPIIINQFYCPKKNCGAKTSAVHVSNVKFIGHRGTSTSKIATIDLRCSKSVACNNIILEDINIAAAGPGTHNVAHCINAHGIAHTINPVVKCMLK